MQELSNDIASSESTEGAQSLPFEFRGDGVEYFKIWIVNVLLTILTLGIYSAWAKVRSNRYFYSNFYLDGESFRYLANPITILKSRIIAVLLFVVYLVLVNYSTLVSALSVVAVMLASPFFIVRSIAFSNRMTAYRNIQFRFRGDYPQAFAAIIGWPILGVLTLGILYPFSMRKLNEFIVNNSSYGTARFQFTAKTNDYVVILLRFILIMLPVGFFGGIFLNFVPLVGAFILVAGYTAGMAFLMTRTTNLYFNASQLGAHGFDSRLEIPGLLSIYATNFLLTVITLGLFLPFAKVRLARYRANCLTLLAASSLDGFIAAEQEQVNALGEELGEVFDFDIGAI